jgi:hypothetical protein
MKRCLLLLIAVLGMHNNATAQSTFDEDERSRWECAYPYKSTNCQKILISYRNDHAEKLQRLFDGAECSNCDTKYVTDHLGKRHAVHSICRQPKGAKFVEKDFLQPITIHKESSGDATGWNIARWYFETCFQTWDCNNECSIHANPPVCIKMKPTNWGRYVALLDGACTYGEDGSENQEDEGGPLEPDDSDQEPPRDTTWDPSY